MQHRKFLRILIVALIVFIPYSALADVSPINPAYVQYMQERRARNTEVSLRSQNAAPEDRPAGYVPSPLNWSHLNGKVWNVAPNEEDSETTVMKRLSNSEENLPPKYDLRDGFLPPVRDQAPFDNCWTHSAMAATESNLIKQGLAGTDIELSEWYITYYAYNDGDFSRFTQIEPDEPEQQDEYYNEGGDDWKAVALLARGTGSVRAATVNNVAAEKDIYAPPVVKREYRLDNAYYLGSRGRREVPSTEDGRQKMLKEALMEYGALSVGM